MWILRELMLPLRAEAFEEARVFLRVTAGIGHGREDPRGSWHRPGLSKLWLGMRNATDDERIVDKWKTPRKSCKKTPDREA